MHASIWYPHQHGDGTYAHRAAPRRAHQRTREGGLKFGGVGGQASDQLSGVFLVKERHFLGKVLWK